MFVTIYFHFFAPDEERITIREGFLPEFSVELKVHDSISKILDDIGTMVARC